VLKEAPKMRFTFVISLSIPGILSRSNSSFIQDAFQRGMTPEGCRQLSNDELWPLAEVWMKEVPGVVPTRPDPCQKHPDYRITARNAKDVQNAIKFAAKHNIRVSIIASGHDYMGRNDAPSGIWIDLSKLKGVRVSPSFTPTEEGLPSPEGRTNVIPPQSTVAAVTFRAGMNTVSLNKAIKDSRLFTLGAAHGKHFDHYTGVIC
jgi:hypothetical protein